MSDQIADIISRLNAGEPPAALAPLLMDVLLNARCDDETSLEARGNCFVQAGVAFMVFMAHYKRFQTDELERQLSQTKGTLLDLMSTFSDEEKQSPGLCDWLNKITELIQEFDQLKQNA